MIREQEKLSKVKIKGNAKYAYIIASITVIVVLSVIILLSIKNADTQYMVQNGTIENTELASAFVIKDEVVINKDMSKVLLPIVAEGHRVAKGSIIATYKGAEYENYLSKLEEMDKEILELMKDLPTVYSSEIENIEKQIHSVIKKTDNESSYIKMQEYKIEVNSLINKRAELLGNLSPDGAAIKEKILERNLYVAKAKKSNDNIIANKSGLVSYETDGLEEILTNKKIDTFSVNDIEEKCKNININNNKIKIVNNYEAYFVTEVSKNNYQYMKEKKNYIVRLMGDDTYEFNSTLYKISETNNGYQAIFKITNGIEHLISNREIEIEIVWWDSTGLFVTNNSLVINKENNITYVKVMKYGNYIDVPVKIVKQNEEYSIIDNYSSEEVKSLNLDREYSLKVYDRIVIQSEESGVK